LSYIHFNFNGAATMNNVPTYTVTLKTPSGQIQLDVPTFQGAQAAGRRALFAAAQAGWGDLDTITVEGIANA
jgi:hypothetical protein